MKASSSFLILTAIAAAACQGGDTESGTLVQLGAASMRVPSGWESSLTDPSNTRQVWAPTANDDKETIALRVVARPPGVVADDLLDSAVDSQSALMEGHVIKQERITTQGKLPAIWMEVSFQPPNADATYTRTHVTVVGAGHVFHIMYTARTPDRALKAVHLAVDSIREEG